LMSPETIVRDRAYLSHTAPVRADLPPCRRQATLLGTLAGPLGVALLVGIKPAHALQVDALPRHLSQPAVVGHQLGNDVLEGICAITPF